MKLVHPRLSVDQLCFPDVALAAFVGHCRTLGVGTVVVKSPDLLADGGLVAARAAFGAEGPAIAAINHPFAVSPDLDRDDGSAVDTLVRLLRIADQLDARSVYLLTGGRGALSWEEAADRFTALVGEALPTARELGVSVMVENASALYADIHIAHTLIDTLALAERAGVGVCIDLQFCWAEADLAPLFARAVPRCGLVQVSDYMLGDRAVPGRAVPGDGVVPLERLVAELLAAGYGGVFDIELLGPRIDTEGHLAAATRAVEQLHTLLTGVGA